MDDDRTRPAARPKPGADDVTVEDERGPCAPLVDRFVAGGAKRPVGHADAGQVEHRAEVERKAGVPRVVAAGRIDEQHVGTRGERGDGLRECVAFAQREPPRLVRGTRTHGHRDRAEQPVSGLLDERGARPSPVARLPRALLAPREGEEAARRDQRLGRLPPRDFEPRKAILLGVELVGRRPPEPRRRRSWASRQPGVRDARRLSSRWARGRRRA